MGLKKKEMMVIIEKKLTDEFKITSDLIQYFVSKTRMKDAIIESAEIGIGGIHSYVPTINQSSFDVLKFLDIKLKIQHPHSKQMNLIVHKHKIVDYLRASKINSILI